MSVFLVPNRKKRFFFEPVSMSDLMGSALCRRTPTFAFQNCRFSALLQADLWLFFGTLGSITKDTLRSRPGFLLISGGFCFPWLLFGCLVPLLCVLGDPGKILGRSWDDPGPLEGTRKDPARSRLGFYRFFDDLGDPF